MKTKDIRTALSQHIFKNGVRNVPFKVRLRIAKKKTKMRIQNKNFIH